MALGRGTLRKMVSTVYGVRGSNPWGSRVEASQRLRRQTALLGQTFWFSGFIPDLNQPPNPPVPSKQ
jgi:hypothetical protein